MNKREKRIRQAMEKALDGHDKTKLNEKPYRNFILSMGLRQKIVPGGRPFKTFGNFNINKKTKISTTAALSFFPGGTLNRGKEIVIGLS